MADSILEGLKNNELVMHYQPIMCLDKMQIACWESLARWYHPELGLLYPYSFIEKAERQPDAIFGVFKFGLESALNASHVLKSPVSVNLSAVSLDHKHFLGEVTRYQGSPIALEITERSSMEFASSEQLQMLSDVEALGYTFMIDDFTAISFNHLSSILGAFKDLNRVKVKLDMHLIQSLGDPKNLHIGVIIKAIVNCAHDMGIKVVCEGVEKPEQAKFLRDIGCDYAQGYYFGKPKALVVIPEEYTDVRSF